MEEGRKKGVLQSLCFANSDICLTIGGYTLFSIGGYTLFFRLLYIGIGGLVLLSFMGLIFPKRLFGNRFFAGASLFWTLQIAALTIAMQHY